MVVIVIITSSIRFVRIIHPLVYFTQIYQLTCVPVEEARRVLQAYCYQAHHLMYCTDIDMYSQYVLYLQYSNLYHIVHGLHSDNVKRVIILFTIVCMLNSQVLIHVTVMVHNVYA